MGLGLKVLSSFAIEPFPVNVWQFHNSRMVMVRMVCCTMSLRILDDLIRFTCLWLIECRIQSLR